MTNINRCKDCGKDLGFINWSKLQKTDEIRCSECALKEFGL